MKLNNLRNIAERAARVVPVVGGIIVMVLVFYWQYQHKTAVLTASLNRWCSRRPLNEWELRFAEPPSPECAAPDTLNDVWLPALGRTLVLTCMVAILLAIVGFGLYAAFASKISFDTRQPIMKSNTVRANLAPIASVLATSSLAITMMAVLFNLIIT